MSSSSLPEKFAELHYRAVKHIFDVVTVAVTISGLAVLSAMVDFKGCTCPGGFFSRGWDPTCPAHGLKEAEE